MNKAMNPCEICGQPTASKYRVCTRTAACKVENAQRSGWSTQVTTSVNGWEALWDKEPEALKAERARGIAERDLGRVTALMFGSRWYFNIIPGTVIVDKSTMLVSFRNVWNATGEVRTFTLPAEDVRGIQETA
jgi:hypothetical protein